MAYEFTPQEILAEFERRQNEKDQPDLTSNVESAKELVTGYPERIGNIIESRKEDVVKAIQSRDEGRSSSQEMWLQTIGKGVAGTMMDVAGETIGTAVGTASDLYDPKVRQGFNDLMKGVVESDSAKLAIDMYQSLDENTRKNVESIFNIGNVKGNR